MTTVWYKIKCFWQLDVWSMVFLDHDLQCFWRWIFPCFDVTMFKNIGSWTAQTILLWCPLKSSTECLFDRRSIGHRESPSEVAIIGFACSVIPVLCTKKWCTLKSGVLWSFCPASLCCTLLGIPNTLQHRLQWSVVTNVTKNTSIIRTSPKGLPSWLYQWFCENQFMYCDKTNNCKSLDLDCFQETIHIYTVKMMKSRRMRM